MQHGLAINMMVKFRACFSKLLLSLENRGFAGFEATALICPEVLMGSAKKW
jgi:hypothetical protein